MFADVMMRGRDRAAGGAATAGRRHGRAMWLTGAVAAMVLSVGAAAPGIAADEEAAQSDDPAVEQSAPPVQAEEENPPIGGLDLDLIRKAVKGSWEGMVERWLTPFPVPKDGVIYLEDGYALSHVAVSYKMEIVREEGDTVWLRGLPPENPESPLHPMWLRRQHDELLMRGVQDWTALHGDPYYFIDFQEELVPPPFLDSLELEPSSDGLPDRGRWQMNFVLADMNGDGVEDLVHPPMRKGVSRPFVFLGAGDGTFSAWQGQRYSDKVPFDYGSVAVADFDGDGHQDIAIGIHFKTQWVMYGDGAGDFTRVTRLPNPDPRISSRAVTAADFDLDGRVDLAFLAELDFDLGTNVRIEDSPTVWVVSNQPSGWTLVTDGLPGRVIGDNIRSADLDRDGRPDLVVASNASHFRDLLLLNRPDGSWMATGNRLVLANGYHFDVQALTEGEDGVVYAVFSQFLKVLGENESRTGIIRYVLGDEGLHAPDDQIVMDDERFNPYYRLAAGDLNGDGLTDLVAGRKQGGLEVYVQSSDGEFSREIAPEVERTGRPYELRLADLDGDGFDDLIASFAETEEAPGGVSVWLTRPRS